MKICQILCYSLFFTLVSCSNDPFKAGSSCDLGSAEGIQTIPYTGAELSSKQLSFMFVGGPTKTSSKIAAFLSGRDIKASFFSVGWRVLDVQNAMDAIYSYGHLVGNMGYSGDDLKDSLDPRMSIRSTEWNLLKYIKGSMFLLYMTDYRFDVQQVNYLNQSGLNKYVGPIKPDIGDVDDRGTDFITDDQCWEQGKTERQCADIYLAEIERVGKGLVIFHDTNEKTYTMLQILVDELTGYQIVPLQNIPNIANALSLAGADTSAETSSGTCNDYN